MTTNEQQREFNHKKAVILFLWQYKCYLCKYQSPSNHVHHIDENHSNNNSFNLIPLCATCHRMTHKLTFVWKVDFNSHMTYQLNHLEYLYSYSNKKLGINQNKIKK